MAIDKQRMTEWHSHVSCSSSYERTRTACIFLWKARLMFFRPMKPSLVRLQAVRRRL